MSPFANLTFQLAFDPAGENFHTAALTLGADDDSGQATPLLSNFNVRHGASFAIRQSETISMTAIRQRTLCVYLDASVYVHLIVIQSFNGQPLSKRDSPKPKGNYTGERLKMLRPETYRRVVRLLAEPRQSVSYREICRQCHLTDDTVKAIEQREAISIATRKQALMEQAARIARLAADRVEDQIDSATLPQAVVTMGVMTDKVLALSADPALIFRHEHAHLHAHKHQFQAITRENWQQILDQLPGDDPPSSLTTPIVPSLSPPEQQDNTDNAKAAPVMPVDASNTAPAMHSHSQTANSKKG